MNVSRPGFLAATGLDLTPSAAPPLMIFSYIDNLYVQYGMAVELDRQLGAHPAGVGVGEDHRVRGEAERSAVAGCSRIVRGSSGIRPVRGALRSPDGAAAWTGVLAGPVRPVWCVCRAGQPPGALRIARKYR